MTNPSTGFDGLGIAPNLLSRLTTIGYTTPTPIQSQSIPLSVQGQDMIGIAQTGTGKTLAFAVPMIQRLAQNTGRGLILLPTRELALQVDETFQKILRGSRMTTAVLIGGASMYPQVQALRNRPHIIIATPGRLIDHMEQRNVNLDQIRMLVLDEADRMLDMGFAPQLKKIFQAVPKERQTLLFSATMPDDIAKIANTHMKTPVRVEIARAGTMADTISQELFIVGKAQKPDLLVHLLGELQGTVLVFVRTKHGASKLTRHLVRLGNPAAEIHANRSLAQRKAALAGFKQGKFRVLVATDIASRGIDVTNIAYVVNYDLPDSTDDFVHRIGRTGRAGKTGNAISFVQPDQMRDLRDIERLIRKPIPRKDLPANLPKFLMAPEPPRADFGSQRPGGRRHFPGQSRSGSTSRGYQGSSPAAARPAHRSRTESSSTTTADSVIPAGWYKQMNRRRT